ncbi:MAG: magnesium transporter CorA family protein [Acidimicrobiia bacterium]|nr:magnesium transporter CorA family protein [Acidimicrobiia bacterium]MBP8180547.1 magnesium transporter CorA family protein [Acidimicrobiia bacterium]
MHDSLTPAFARRSRAWRDGKLIGENFPLSEVSDYLASSPDTVVWVDLCEPDKAQLLTLAEEFSLHELAVEDALAPHQRPKLDHYETHKFLVIRAMELDAETGELLQTEVDSFISSRWLITIRKNERFKMDPVVARWDRSPDLTKYGVAFLLYGLLDYVVDEYFQVIDRFDDYYDQASQALFEEQPLDATQQKNWFENHQALVRFHRQVVSMREAISGLMRREHDLSDVMYPYYQDVYDHILRISESTDTLRDLGSSIMDTNLALRDFRQNQKMNRVTSWAAIVAVPTLVTGYFGMNVPYPGEGSHIGVIVSALLTLVVPLVMYVYFRKRDLL